MWLGAPWAFHPGLTAARQWPGRARRLQAWRSPWWRMRSLRSSLPLRDFRAGYGARLTFCWRGRQALGRGHGCRCFPVAAHRYRAHPPHGGSASLPGIGWSAPGQLRQTAHMQAAQNRQIRFPPRSGKRYAVVPDEVEQAVSEHAGLCIDMRADEILISARAPVRNHPHDEPACRHRERNGRCPMR
jgi:hypothetical protein